MNVQITPEVDVNVEVCSVVIGLAGPIRLVVSDEGVILMALDEPKGKMVAQVLLDQAALTALAKGERAPNP